MWNELINFYSAQLLSSVSLDLHHSRPETSSTRTKALRLRCIVQRCLQQRDDDDDDDDNDYLSCFRDQCSPSATATDLRRSGSSPFSVDSGRDKRWQYTDMLQLCIRTSCHGQRGVSYYNCVYRKCITPQQPPYI